jgi:predicted choloylglycine hydrolase
MTHVKASYLELKGTYYEIGQKLGQITASIPPLKTFLTSGWHQFNSQDAALAKELFDRWCPGLNEEIQGFADALGVNPIQVTYYAMTYLIPGCSQMVLLPGLTENRRVLLARNYEFSHQMEDFTLTRTSVEGKYTHLGSSVMQLGRDEGLNEHGLAVSMSSCGFPVGAPEEMRRPALRGLQFWAVIRTLLENCKDVSESLAFLEGMPIAYNINLLLADRSGYAALVETVDGHMATKQIHSTNQIQYLHATNHVVLPELKQYEPKIMKHSFQRYDTIRQYLDHADHINPDDIKGFLLTRYPQGLCCHYYNDFFGTTKSMVMDLNEGKIDVCWGGLASNGWQTFWVNRPLEEGVQPVELSLEKPQMDLCELI